MYLKQNTSVDVGIGPFLDDTDGKTPETGLAITQPDIRLKKNNGAWAQKNAAQTLTHEENGWYELTLDATDTNTLGILIVAIHETGALPVWKEYQVVPANVYDALVAGTDVLQVDTTEVTGTAASTQLADALLDRTSAVDGKTLRQLFRYIGAVLFGKATGLPNSPIFRRIDDTDDAVTATTDGAGNRSTVTFD